MRGEITTEMFDCVPEIDFHHGYRFFLGNIENYSRALMSILKSIKSKLPLLRLMHQSDEYEGLRTIAQTLRKMLGNIGAAGIADLSYQLEMALLNEDIEYFRDQLDSYIEIMEEFSDHLETLLKKMDVNHVAKPKEEPSFLNYDFEKTKESIKLSSDLLERKII